VDLAAGICTRSREAKWRILCNACRAPIATIPDRPLSEQQPLPEQHESGCPNGSKDCDIQEVSPRRQARKLLVENIQMAFDGREIDTR
jgi:hypothetical protein